MPENRLLHVLGGGPWQLPTVRRAKALGLRVLVSDMYADRPAYSIADAHEVVDITDAAATLAAARRHGISGILCDSTDTGVATAAFVAEQLGLPGIGAAARACTNKAVMRTSTANAGLASPPFQVACDAAGFDAALQRIGLPVVVKPVDNQSGRGVNVLSVPAQATQAFEAAMAMSRSRQVLVEGRLKGQEYIVDAFVDGASLHILGIAAKRPYADNPTLSSRIVYLEGATFDALHTQLAPIHRQVVDAVGLRRGIVHAEYIVDERIGPVPIDVAARGGGVMIYSHVLPHVSGVDAIGASIACALGDAVAAAPTCRRAACIEFFRLPCGQLAELTGVAQAAEVAGVAAVHVNVAPGDTISAMHEKDDRPGFIVALAETAEQAVDIAQRARSLIRARVVGVTRRARNSTRGAIA